MIKALDKVTLRRPEVMAAVLERYAESRGVRSGKLCFTCPLHSHKHPEKGHLRIDIGKDGAAVAICDSYGPIGDVFELYGRLAGTSNFKEQFLGCAELVGYQLQKEQAGFRPRRTAPMLNTALIPTPAPTYLPADQERAAWQAVDRANQHEEILAQHAACLGLPVQALLPYTSANDVSLPCGLLGLDEQHRLLYIYTQRDEAGAWRIPLVKVRMPEGSGSRFVCWKGSNKQSLWGAGSIVPPQTVIITEGESDALAVRYSLNFAMGQAYSAGRKSTGALNVPRVVAKPDAGTFKTSWASSLRGCDVILLVDNDEAGRAGAAKTADILHRGGVRHVSIWLPPDGCKDARAAFRIEQPNSLILDIFNNAKEDEEK